MLRNCSSELRSHARKNGSHSGLNDQVEHLFGCRGAELIGQKIEILVPERFRGEHPEQREHFFVHPQTRKVGSNRVVQGLRKDGSEFPAEINLSPLAIEGEFLASSAIRDITDRTRAEDALFLEKERAQVALNCIGDAVNCTDISGKITFRNIVAKKMTGWTWQEAARRPMSEVFQILDAATREFIPNPMDIAVGLDRTMHLPSSCILVRRNGIETPIEDSVAPIH